MQRLMLMLNVALVLVSVGLVVYTFGVKEERRRSFFDPIGITCEDRYRDIYQGPFTEPRVCPKPRIPPRTP